MPTVKGLREKIERLETSYTELLGAGATAKRLSKIWKEIRTLRLRLKSTEMKQSPPKKYG